MFKHPITFLKKLYQRLSKHGTLAPPTPTVKDKLHVWEDDFSMIELLPPDNLIFLQEEIKRLNDFNEKHYTPNGFTGSTVISEEPFKTIDLLINITEIEELLTNSGLRKVESVDFHAPYHTTTVNLVAYGTNSFALICENQGNLLKEIWLTGHRKTEEDKQHLQTALMQLGLKFNFIGVNWFQHTYYYLTEQNGIKSFIEDCC
jgi:hypothetical protein